MEQNKEDEILGGKDDTVPQMYEKRFGPLALFGLRLLIRSCCELCLAEMGGKVPHPTKHEKEASRRSKK